VLIVKSAARDFSVAARNWPRTASRATLAWVAARWRQLRSRYGPRYLQVMLVAGLVTFFVPVPGSTVITVTSILAVAEVHLAITRWRGRAVRAQQLSLERPAPSGEKA
jgi:hypothetical protein